MIIWITQKQSTPEDDSWKLERLQYNNKKWCFEDALVISLKTAVSLNKYFRLDNYLLDT